MFETVIELVGNTPGKTLLVTGGVDGDEYAGIEAAYALVEKYKNRQFSGRLIIIPIVNMPGFKAECSHNPRDGKFPKMVFPGSMLGSSTARMVHALITRYAYKADVWLDMHGGASTEGLFPFMWIFKTGITQSDELSEKFSRLCGAETILLENAGSFSKAHALAKRGCTYIMAESGEQGLRRPADIERHVQWAEMMMQTLGMTASHISENSQQNVFHNYTYIQAPCNGIFRQTHTTLSVTEGETLGTYSNYDGTNTRTLTAPVSGRVLWYKIGMSMRTGDILWAIAH